MKVSLITEGKSFQKTKEVKLRPTFIQKNKYIKTDIYSKKINTLRLTFIQKK